MKTTPLNSFLKFYVMRSPGIDLYGIAHVKVDFIPLQKMYVIPILGRFVWTTSFVQCVFRIQFRSKINLKVAWYLSQFAKMFRRHQKFTLSKFKMATKDATLWTFEFCPNNMSIWILNNWIYWQKGSKSHYSMIS